MPLVFSASLMIRLKIVQHEAKEKLEKSMLETLVLCAGEFNWYKKNKEISIGGRLFDVKSFSEMNGRYTFKGIYDENETALNKQINYSFNERTNQLLTGVFQLLFSAFSTNSPELTTVKTQSAISFPLILHHLAFPFLDIPTPPPQLAIAWYFEFIH
ncbi:MAG TPA: hypothetical protein VFP97_16400 [Chitinophagaceae bacterium]|nr:hypothetical protein [Chitinophagaceae bacterium]